MEGGSVTQRLRLYLAFVKRHVGHKSQWSMCLATPAWATWAARPRQGPEQRVVIHRGGTAGFVRLEQRWHRPLVWRCSSHCCSTKHFPGKFQTVYQNSCGKGRDPGDICIDQGFTFTHTRVPSQAVIQGLFGLASNSRSAVSWVQTDVPGTAFLMKVPGPTRLPALLNSCVWDFDTASTPPLAGRFY